MLAQGTHPCGIKADHVTFSSAQWAEQHGVANKGDIDGGQPGSSPETGAEGQLLGCKDRTGAEGGAVLELVPAVQETAAGPAVRDAEGRGGLVGPPGGHDVVL